MLAQPLFRALIVLFAMVAVGFLAGKIKFISEQMTKELSGYLMLIGNPMQVFSSVLSGEYPMTNLEALKLTALAFTIYFVMIGAGLLLAKVFPKAGPKKTSVYQFVLIFSNIGFIGYPIVEAVFGVRYTFYLTVFVLAFQLFCWTWGVCLFSGEKLRLSWKVLCRPAVVAALAAYVFYFCRIPCPKIVYEVCYKIGATTTVLAMIVLGASLSTMKLGEVFGEWRMYVVALIKMVAMPIAWWAVLRLIIADPVELEIVILMLSMPTATNATIIPLQYGGDVKAGSAGVFLTTLMAMGSIPLIFFLLF